MKIIDKSLMNRAFGITALVAAIVLFIAACGNKSTGDISSPNYPAKPSPEITDPGTPDPELVYFNVSFEAGEYSYSTYPSQTIKEDKEASKPAVDPVKIIPGLYEGDYGPSAFMYWYNEEDGIDNEWFFSERTIGDNIVLKARWLNPDQAEGFADIPGDNVIERAIAYVEEKAHLKKSYTLYLNEDITLKPQNVKANGFDLTIKGIHEERTISLANGENGALFTLGKWEAAIDNDIKMNFSIGENITLSGKKDKTQNNEALVLIGYLDVTFTMLHGSKITKNIINDSEGAPAVKFLQGATDEKGSFIMEGGEISGNENRVGIEGSTVYKPSSAVLVSAKGTFTMKGGSITGNIGGVGEFVYVVSNSDSNANFNAYNHAELSGNSKIGRIALVEEGERLRRSLDVSEWDPVNSVVLNLAGNNSISNIETWFGKYNIFTSPPIDSSIFKKIELGRFYPNNNTSLAISDNNKLDREEGKLVPNK